MAFRSKFEESISNELKKLGVNFEYESISIPYKKNQRLTKKLRELHGLPIDFNAQTYHLYLPDFYLKDFDTYIEVKGRYTSSDRAKTLLVVEQNKGINLKLLLQRDQRIHSGSSTFYSDWCKSNNIDYAIGHVPSRWIAELKT